MAIGGPRASVCPPMSYCVPGRTAQLPRRQSHLKGCRPPPLYLSLFFSLDLYLENINTVCSASQRLQHSATPFSCGRCDSQVFVTITFQGTGPLQVTSDLLQVLYLCLQSLDLTAERRTLSPRTSPRWSQTLRWCYLVVDVQPVVFPGLQGLIKSSVTLNGGVGQNGTSAAEPEEQQNIPVALLKRFIHISTRI